MNQSLMKVEAVTVSVNYSDYLLKCISNKMLLDRWLIITHQNDKKTIQVCKDNELEYICSDRIYDNAYFAKGRGVNDGLNKIKPLEWILQLDSDILLPDNFRDVLMQAELDNTCIYGSPRFYTTGNRRIEINNKTNEPHMRPLFGFFQLWHSLKYIDYPECSMHAGGDDTRHSLRFEWPDKWKYLDLHLIDVSGVCNQNWYGRGKHRWIR